MSLTLDQFLILLAVICFALDAGRANLRVNLVSLGFALLALTLIV